jgi:hypothetical protein
VEHDPVDHGADDWPDFNGLTGVDRAVQIVTTGSTGGP